MLLNLNCFQKNVYLFPYVRYKYVCSTDPDSNHEASIHAPAISKQPGRMHSHNKNLASFLKKLIKF